MVFDKKYYSLSVNTPLRLTYDESIKLESDNENVITRDGMLLAKKDYSRPSGQATISAKRNGVEVDSCKVTIVNWEANTLGVDTKELDTLYRTFVESDGFLYGFSGNNLYSTSDGFKTRTLEGTTNIYLGDYPVLDTPYGFFARDSTSRGVIYKSQDLLNWELCFTPALRGLYHTLDFYFEKSTGNLYVYAGEYSADGLEDDRNHKVYRGVFNSAGEQEWSTILTFYSTNERTADPTKSPSARHVHMVQVDKRTGGVWVGTGDNADQCHILLSENHGADWRTIGTGEGMNYVPSQVWRGLSFWFTDDYIYWNMDTSQPQSIWRLSRVNLPNHNTENDLKEHVQQLSNGSMWYHCWAEDLDGNDVIIMGQAAEGERRDWLSRLFYIKETEKGEVDIKELASTPSSNPEVYSSFMQFEPKIQDKNGYLYVNGRGTPFSRTLRCKFAYDYRPLKYKFINPFKME